MSLITVGIGLMLRDVVFMVAGPQIRQYAIDQTRVYDLGLVRIAPGQAVAICVAAVVVPAVAYLLARTPIGKSMRAVSDNRDLAAISGIDVDRIGTYVWILAGALAGLGGVMFAMIQGTFDPNLGYQILFLILTSVVLGGIGNAYGALVAGVVLGMVMELSTWSGLAGGLDARMKPVLAFAALIALAAVAAAGTVRQGAGALTVDFLNPAFWTFVAVIAGIYAIMALGLYVQFSLAGLPNFGHVAFMATAAYVMAILVVRYHVSLPLASLGAIAAAVAVGLLLARSRAAAARRLSGNRDHRRRRDRALSRDESARAHRRARSARWGSPVQATSRCTTRTGWRCSIASPRP